MESNGIKKRTVSKRAYKGKFYYQFNIPKKWGDKYIDDKEEIRVIEKGNELTLRPIRDLDESQTVFGGRKHGK